jgi:hypothetical protein
MARRLRRVLHLADRSNSGNCPRPILAGLPCSAERLFPEFHDQILFRPSARYATIYCTLFALMLGDRFEQHPPFTDTLSTAHLAALAINLFWALRGPLATGQRTAVISR